MWLAFSTDSQEGTTRAVAEASDLVLKMGRLASGHPRWTPAWRERGPRPSLTNLARTRDDATQVLGAVHQAADAIAVLARSDAAAIRATGQVGRLYMRQAILWAQHQDAQNYTRPPRNRLDLLHDMYQVIATTTEHAAMILDGIALACAAPSRLIALARTASPRQPPGTAQDLRMDDIEPRLVLLKQPRRWPGAEPADLDHQAIIRAYQDRHLSISECTRRFAARSNDVITGILTTHSIPLRPEPATPEPEPAPRHRPDKADIPKRRLPGHVEARLRALSITDPALIARAITLDRATKDLIAQAETLAQPRPARRRPPPKPKNQRSIS